MLPPLIRRFKSAWKEIQLFEKKASRLLRPAIAGSVGFSGIEARPSAQLFNSNPCCLIAYFEGWMPAALLWRMAETYF